MIIIKEKITKLQARLTQSALSYIKANILELEVLIVVIFILNLCKSIPYLNILINKYISLFIVIVLFHYLFKVHNAVILIITLLLFVPSYIYMITGNGQAYEQTGNLIYFLLWYICLVTITDLWKQQKK